jgi:hypothetical protein
MTGVSQLLSLGRLMARQGVLKAELGAEMTWRHE